MLENAYEQTVTFIQNLVVSCFLLGFKFKLENASEQHVTIIQNLGVVVFFGLQI